MADRMFRRFTASVRVRVAFLAMVVVGFAGMVGAGTLINGVKLQLLSETRRATTEELDRTVAALAAGVPASPAGATSQPGMFVMVLNPDGSPIATGSALVAPGGPLDALGNPQPGTVVAMPVDLSGISLQNGPVGAFDLSVPINGKLQKVDVISRSATVDGQAVNVVGVASLVGVESNLEVLRAQLRIAVPILVLLVGAVAWLLTGRALRPVERMRADVEAISGSTLDRRVLVPASRDEVGRLARTMNSMLARLQRSRDHERQFLSDVSHELRSPLASIRAQVEVAPLDDPVLRSFRHGVLAETGRLERIVADLLVLARAEEGAVPTDEVELDSVVLEEIAAVNRTSRVTVDATAVSAGRVTGSADALGRVARNLLDNAVRHASSRVAVSLAESNGTVTLAVDDDGPGVPESERDRVFERFARTAEGRDRSSGGVGLGLAVVRSTIARHGGTVSCQASPLGGARFVATLPCSS